MLSNMELPPDDEHASPGGKQNSRVSAVLPVLALCTVQALMLMGCNNEGLKEIGITGDMQRGFVSFFEVGDKVGDKGCEVEDLVRMLEVDGRSGLTEQQLYDTGVTICHVPMSWSTSNVLEGRCIKPVARVHNELDIVCPFLFNVWELPRNRKYGKGEQVRVRRTMSARCLYSDHYSQDPKWCFTAFCNDLPLACFTSEKAAEAGRPWEMQGENNATTATRCPGCERRKLAQLEEGTLARFSRGATPHANVKKSGKKSSLSELLRETDASHHTESSHEVPLQSVDVSEGSAVSFAQSDEGSPHRISPSLGENHVAVELDQHHHKGARRSALQVTQRAIAVAEHA